MSIDTKPEHPADVPRDFAQSGALEIAERIAKRIFTPCPPEVHSFEVEVDEVNDRARCGHPQALAHDRRGLCGDR